MKYRYEIPQGLTDEIKWFRYFSIRSLLVFICTAGLGVPLIRLLGGFGITLYLIVFWVFVVIAVTLSTMLRIPAANWLSGGGEYIDQHLIKRLIRRKHRCLYIKGYNQPVYEERERELERKLQEAQHKAGEREKA